jgi:DNA-binding GntR family transcriptional regulator
MLFARQKSQDDTVVKMLASALRRDISFGVLRPDQKLKIEALRQNYGGSNHSMRETLRILVAEGMVEAVNQRGFRVTSATSEDQADILQMRLDLEQLGLIRSLNAGGVDWEAAVIAAQHRLSHADMHVQNTPDDTTTLAWDEACKAFSESLISACGSPRLIDTMGRIYNQSRRFRLALLREGRIDFNARAKRHDALKNAIVTRDTKTALSLQEADIRADMS